eukprot:13436670-Heterocapsa_arctica.AAC.1
MVKEGGARLRKRQVLQRLPLQCLLGRERQQLSLKTPRAARSTATCPSATASMTASPATSRRVRSTTSSAA